ncbi:MAG: hypothetical protein F4Y49_11765 [Dehalococcoidia bacterium]|nr:hypothetical protein [Dehalococcoidia bacterium]MYA61718.1 hypothetical protein [Dehalococcoidia bacterium]
MVANPLPEVFHYPLEVDDKLAELDLSQALLWSALRRGLDYKCRLTRYHTNAIRGLGVWDAINVGLGETLQRLGWNRKEPGNFAITVHPEEKLCIAVMSGNAATGSVELPSSNSTPLQTGSRSRTREAVINNRVALGLQRHFFQMMPSWEQPVPTYFLLHRIDADAGEIRAELSLPTFLPDRYITDWHTRIILTPPERQMVAMPYIEPYYEDPGDEIDVPVVEIE